MSWKDVLKKKARKMPVTKKLNLDIHKKHFLVLMLVEGFSSVP